MNIAVLVGGIIYDSQKDLIYGIRDYAEEKDAKVFVFTCGGDIYSANDHSKGEFHIYSLPEWGMFDGIIVVPDSIQNPSVVKKLEEELEQQNIPVIVIDGKMGNMCSFMVDNVSALYDVTKHVIKDHGKRKILYLSGPGENAESVQRLKGFLDCVEEHQLQEKKDFCVMYGDFWIDSGKSVVTEYLQKYGVPEAVICANDYMAIGALESLQAAGYQIPQDVIVTGVDNSFEGRYNQPRLTTIQKPLYEMGKEACRCLCEQSIEQDIYQFPVRQVLSESCGCNLEREERISEFKKKMLEEKRINYNWSGILNSMSADLNELSTFEEFIEKLKSYIIRMNFPYFYLCLCDSKQLLGELKMVDGIYQVSEVGASDYTDVIKVAIAYENGVFKKTELIQKSQFLPQSFFEKEESILSIIMPIHFRLHCMGYCVVGNSSLPLESIQFQSWIMNLGNGIENIRKQMMMQEMVNQLNRMWIYDTMTGVLNRAGFYIKVKEVLAKCKELKEQILILFVDADYLKTVNDTYGHEEGDFYIKSIAKICQKYAGDEGIAMRYGGDEFVILRRYCKEDSYEKYVANIKEDIHEIKRKENKPYLMDVSIGHYISDVDDDLKLEAILEQADRDMYLMKKSRIETKKGE